MLKLLNKLPKELKDLISLAGDIASQHNTSAYLVGGFVRDLILGADNLDLDIVVERDGINFAQDFAEALKAKLICHRRFCTATVIRNHNLKIDFATARKEIYPQPASLPVVTPGTLRDDLARRDFSINAMAINISKGGLGKLIDFFNGEGDLVNKKIRVLHNLSFIDDPTRILRAIRFATRYNFSIEPKTFKLLKQAVKRKMLERVQPQRLRDELILILKENRPIKSLKRIEELAGFGFISAHLNVSRATDKLLSSIESEINWFKRNYFRRRLIDTWLIYFIGLINQLKINEIEAICKKFVFRKGEEKRILSYKRLNQKFILELSKAKIKPAKIFKLLEPLSYEVIILIKAKYKNRNLQRHIEDFFEIYNGMCILVSGDDLHRLGVTPGPYYQKIFAKVLKAKLEGKVKTKEEELALIGKLIKNR